MKPWLSKLAILLIVAPAILIGVLWFAPDFIPAEEYKEQIESKLEDYTGRDVKILGDVRFSFLPRLQLEVNNVTIGQPENLKLASPEMVTLKALYINVQVLPLIGGRVVVERFDLIQPVIELARDAQGKPNWIFTPKNAVPTKKTDEKKPEATTASSLKELAISAIVIQGGTLTYFETPTAKPIKLSEIDANLKAPSLSKAASLEFSGNLEGTGPLALKGNLTTPQQFLDGKDTFTTLTGTLGKDALDVKLSGNVVKLGESFNFTGDVGVNAGSVHKLMQALGNKPAEGAKDMALGISSKLKFASDAASLSDLKANLGDTSVTGKLSAALPKKGQPKIEGELALAKPLDISAFLVTPEEPAKTEAKPEQAKEIVVAPERTNGWSTEPTLPDLTFLRSFDAVLAIKTEGIIANKLTLGAFTLNNTVKDGLARFQIASLPLYGGTATVDATLDGRNPTPVIVKKVSLKDVDGGALLAAYDFDRLTGKVSGTLDLRTKGRSQADLVTQLNGGGDLKFTDGEIRGVNLAQLVDQVKSIKTAITNDGSASSDAVKSDAATKFSSLSGTFTVADGVARNNDLSMLAPLLKASGSGVVNLPKRMVDYIVKPSLVANLEGQTRKADDTSAAITVPIRVTGPFDNLSFRPDATSLVQDIAKDPKGAVKNIEENVKGLKGLFKGL